MSARLLVLTLTAALLAPAAAVAQIPLAPVPEPVAEPAPAPEQVRGKVSIVAERVGRTATVLAGTRVRLRGTVRPYVAGQAVTVRVVQFGRTVFSQRRQVLPAPTGAAGVFLAGYVPKGAGAVVITASHVTTPEMSAAVSRRVGLDVLPRAVSAGSSRANVRTLQRRLKALGYVVGTPGVYDGRTSRAVLAFRKQTGMSRVARADRQLFAALARGAGVFRVRFPRHGRHIEANLARQTLALIGAGGRVERIYPTSSGTAATPTVLGRYRIYRKDYGRNAKGMVDASYFYNGYAIHGFDPVPIFPASHGCLRVPNPDARSISDWGRHGTIVDVYRG